MLAFDGVQVLSKLMLLSESKRRSFAPCRSLTERLYFHYLLLERERILFILYRKANYMHAMITRRPILNLTICLCSIYPLYFTFAYNNRLVVLWLLGLVVLGWYATMRTRCFRAAPEAGLWVGCLSPLLIDGSIFYRSIVGPLQELGSTHITTPEQAGAYGWLPLLYLSLILYCLGLSCLMLVVSLVCTSLGGLLGSLFRTLTSSVARPSVKS